MKSQRIHLSNLYSAANLSIIFCKAIIFFNNYQPFVIFISIMQAKIHKAKLITLHNKIMDPETADHEDVQPAGIHAYMTLLKHLIQKSQSNVKGISQSSIQENSSKVASNTLNKPSSKINLAPLNSNSQTKRKSIKASTNNRQQILNSIMLSSRNLIEINSLSKMQRYNGNGNQSERVSNARDDEHRSFIPIGKIYHQLKHRTETTIENETKGKLNCSSSLKISDNGFEERKKFSIYAKQARSSQRSAFRQNRVTVEKNSDQNAKSFLRINSLSTGQNDSHSRSPTPW